MTGIEAVRASALADPELPRSNGELAFDEPWQGRALALAIALVERSGATWDDFRRELIAAIAVDTDRPYWTSWVAALEAFAGQRIPALTADRARDSEARPASA